MEFEPHPLEKKYFYHFWSIFEEAKISIASLFFSLYLRTPLPSDLEIPLIFYDTVSKLFLFFSCGKKIFLHYFRVKLRIFT